MDENKNPDFLTAKEASVYIRISLPKLYQQVAENRTFPVHKIGEKLIFSRDELKEWVLSQGRRNGTEI